MRIVISLTTIQSRIRFIKPVILSILNQSHDFDVLYLNIPRTYKVRESLRSIDDKRFVLNFCEKDYGPITKLVPTLKLEHDPESIIIFCDDDQIWADNTLETFIKSHEKFPRDALSFSGWCVGNFPFYFQLAWNTEDSHLVDWIQGTTGILIKRGMLDPDKLLDYTEYSDENKALIFKNDDHWISYHLYLNGINRRKIPGKSSDFFKDTEYKHIDAISTEIDFFWKVLKITRVFNFYEKQLPICLETTFISFIVLFCICLVLCIVTCIFYKK